MRIKLQTALDVRDGYGYIGQELALALHNLGHQVWVKPVPIWYSEDQLKPEVKSMFNPISSLDFELIIMYPVYAFKNVHKSAAIMTMYEAHQCPVEWVLALNNLNLPIFAPSKFVQQMFRSSGVNSQIFITPLGVDKSFYQMIYRERPINKPFRFLSIGKMEPRKNSTVLVKAFQKAFTTENVELIIKTRERFVPPQIRQEALNDKRIRIVERTVTEKELLLLFNNCHCFVYPSRGEGFSFPPRNAIATGMPTIVTDWSALAEIPGAIKVKPQSFSPMYPCGFSYGREKELLMADISVDNLAETMYYVYNNYSACCELAIEGREELLSWEDSAKKLTDVITTLL